MCLISILYALPLCTDWPYTWVLLSFLYFMRTCSFRKILQLSQIRTITAFFICKLGIIVRPSQDCDEF